MNRDGLLTSRTRQFGQHNLAPWHWALVAGPEDAVRALVQEGAPPTNIYALGDVLSPQARLIAAFGPPVLVEVAKGQDLVVDAAERLEVIAELLQRHLQRAYRLKHREHYVDLGKLAKNVAAALEALDGSATASHRLLNSLELAEARSRAGLVTNPNSTRESDR